jgi:hypothetical protein
MFWLVLIDGRKMEWLKQEQTLMNQYNEGNVLNEWYYNDNNISLK